MESPRVVAIIPAGGRGSRMGGERPKQYLLLGGRPLLWHVLNCFEESSLVGGIVLVLRPEDMDYCRCQVLEPGGFRKIRAVVPGGRERCDSVGAGLQATGPEDEIVVVHDAVRPFVSQALLQRVIEAAVAHRAAIAGLPVRETIKQVEGGRIVQTPDREGLWSAQTPQAFHRDLLLEAHACMPPGVGATDDAVLVERLGCGVRMVEGDAANLKITTPEDLAWAEWSMSQRESGDMKRRQMRVGQGFDVHALAAGRELVLGGVHIPFACGLAGHSDADVLTHAIIDALLGAVAGGDIGRLFPDTDTRYKDISSLLLLEKVRQLLVEKGAEILNLDAVIMAQRPRLAPHLQAMSEKLAAALQLVPNGISLKATTTEGLGFVGRQEGIAAQAVALVEM